MYRNPFVMVLVLFLVTWGFLSACTQSEAPEALNTGSNPELSAHTAEFKKEVIKITDGVYVAVGFGLANSIFLVGDDGVIIIDTMESAEAAEAVKAEFLKISSKAVKAIIYTHYHSDHTFGAKTMAGNHNPEVYSHASTSDHLNRVANITRETTYRRAMRQFGVLLPEGTVLNAGIGPYLKFNANSTVAVIPPTHVFAEDQLELEFAGIKLHLVHTPGETNDQIFIWIPEKHLLLPADNFYKSFPNLYAIRGTPYRDVTRWIKSLDQMRRLRPAYLVPSHSRPISGQNVIWETLTNYRDAIQFVHDQTIRLMNKGLTPQEIVEQVKLPPHLAQQPYLREYYGTVAWSVRAIFDGYLGWFGGNPTDLFPLSPREKAIRVARLTGGEKELFRKAREALTQKDYQWTLELTDQLLQLDPQDDEVRRTRAQALKALGRLQTAATARHYYLTRAMEIEAKLHIGMFKIKDKEAVHSLALESIFNAMAVNLDPAKSAQVDIVAGFRFPDTGEAYTVHVRRGVAEIQPQFPQHPEIAVTVDSKVWKEIIAGLRNPVWALFKDVEKEGGFIKLVKFLSLFKSD